MARRAFGLITVLLSVSVLVMLVASLVGVVRSQILHSRAHLDRIKAEYAAETAIVDAMLELEKNRTWKAGFKNKSMPDGVGTYSVSFGPSVNNLLGDTPAPSDRGPTSIPPRTAFVVATARVGASERRLEALLTEQAMDVKIPLQASGRIKLRGNVIVQKLPTAKSPKPPAAVLHSDKEGDVENAITYEGEPFVNYALLLGNVTARSSSENAIKLPNAVVIGEKKENAASRPAPDLNLQNRIQDMSSASPPDVVSFGTSTIPAGDFYHEGDLEINGDLKLNGGSLYVNGKLTVNGSIRGAGSVYVSKETSFKGDSQVAASGAEKVALYSQGSVKLTGFDVDAYLTSIGESDAEVAEAWRVTKEMLAGMNDALNKNPPDLSSGAPLDQMRRVLDNETRNVTYKDLPTGNLQKLIDKVAVLDQTEARDFVHGRLRSMNRFFDDWSSNGQTPDEVIRNWQWGLSDGNGVFDAALDGSRKDLVPQLRAVLAGMNYQKKAGSSSFVGLIYTNGFFYASNSVGVTGAVVTKGKSEQPEEEIEGTRMEPGDVFLGNSAQVTFIDDLFSGGNGIGGAGMVRVALWLSR